MIRSISAPDPGALQNISGQKFGATYGRRPRNVNYLKDGGYAFTFNTQEFSNFSPVGEPTTETYEYSESGARILGPSNQGESIPDMLARYRKDEEILELLQS